MTEVYALGNIVNKYRVHEVAKDFNIATKEVVDVLTKYAAAPKNHMQALDDSELSLIFESLTQQHPVSNIAVIFAEGAKPAPKKEAPKPEQKTAAGQPAAGEKKPGEAAPAKPVSRVPQTKVVDTRKAANVNLDKYDEKLQEMADRTHRGNSRRDQNQGGKEKFRSRQGKDNRQQGSYGANRRRQEEADRLR